MSNARRDFLRFAGGAAVALPFTPVPWKVLDDVSIRTQGERWAPRPVRGEISFKQASCTLCTTGCPVRVKCAGSQPVGVLPAVAGGLCAFGWATHHLAYQPGRITRTPKQIEEAIAAVRHAIRDGRRVGVVDSWPGRCTSAVYRRLANMYIPAGPSATVGPDLQRARLVLSFGLPVLEDWGTPGLLMRRRDEVRVVQVESRFSITAEMADHWFAVEPEGEAALAYAVVAALGGATGNVVATRIAHELRSLTPAVAVGPGSERINALLGDTVAVAQRRELPPAAGADPVALSAVPDGSIDVLLTETPAIPLAHVRPKLAPKALVVAFAGWPNEYTEVADFVVPTPAPFETVEDVPAAFDAPAACFSLSPALLAAPEGTMAPGDFAARVLGENGLLESMRAERTAAIHKAARGHVDGTPVKDMKADEFEAALKDGKRWVDEVVPGAKDCISCSGGGRRLRTPRPLMAGKLDRESGLRRFA